MSNYQQKEGQGILFKNNRKSSTAQPDMTGTCTINGKELRIAAWSKQSNGTKFLSLKISETIEQTSSQSAENDDDGLF